MSPSRHCFTRSLLAGSALLLVAACDEPLDFDLRSLGNGFDTTNAVRQATLARPAPDARGVISYPNYQVAVARPGDRIGDIAARVGLPADELARYNGIPRDAVLRADEVVVLPRRVEEPSAATGAITSGPLQPGGVDITTIAGNAINRAGADSGAGTGGQNTAAAQAPAAPAGSEPVRHKVERGETAYSIARLYNVSVRSLAEWNGLGSDLSLREGQYLLIPVANGEAPKTAETSAPGEGSLAPEPPSASAPLPDEKVITAAAPASPALASQKTESSAAKMLMPASGRIIRAYAKGTNDGIDIAAPAGSPVKAAADGSVAAITRDTEQVPILVLRHDDNLLTVYAGVDDLTVEKGDKVTRGQTIAKVRAGDAPFLHFEVRKGLESVDPMEYLN